MERLGGWIAGALSHAAEDAYLERQRRDVEELCLRFPVPGIDPPASPRPA